MSVKKWVAALLGGLLLGSAVQAGTVTEKRSAQQALQCRVQAQCAYFGAVYDGDPVFRRAIRQLFRAHRMVMPAWVEAGVMTPLLPLRINGVNYLYGSVCEPHNCPHQLRVLYAPKQKKLVARYDRDDDTFEWLGAPTALQQSVLLGEGDEASPLYQRMDDNTPLPLVVE